MRLIKFSALALVLSLIFICPVHSAQKDVGWALHLDYSLVRELMLRQMFTAPDCSAVAAKGECTMVRLTKPEVSGDGGLVKTKAAIEINAGVKIFGDCARPVEFKGFVEVWQAPYLDGKHWRVRLRTVRSHLLDEQGKPATVANIILGLVDTHVHAYLDQFIIDLAAPHEDLRQQLPLFFKAEMWSKVQAWLDNLSLKSVKAGNEDLTVKIVMTVDAPPVTAEPTAKPTEFKPPTQQEITSFRHYWQAWDSYVMAEILSLAGRDLTKDERDDIMAELLDMRYAFVDALQNGDLDKDIVRRQFVRSWSVLAPILRRHAWRNGVGLFNYLALMNASDALSALDELGPSVGLEISDQGLARLAALVSKDPRWADERFSEETSKRLRQVLDMAPPPSAQDKTDDGPDGSWLDWLVSPAMAAESGNVIDWDEVNAWTPPELGQDPALYMKRLRETMEKESDKVEAEAKLSAQHHGLLAMIIETTAWQESCWRQFVKDGKGRLTYLKSYNGTSVGLMQIHTDVWRGLYDPHKLRWSIEYNAWAGCEILELYLRRYALGRLKKGQTLGDDMLARIVYAMYNGGPREFWRFQKRYRSGRLYISDKLFWQKYQQIKAKDYGNIVNCLVGR